MPRLLTGTVIGLTWLGLLLFAPPLIFWLAISLISLLALREYSRMVLTGGGEKRLRLLLMVTGLLPVLSVGCRQSYLLPASLVIALTIFLLVTIFRYSTLEKPLFFLLSSAFATLYLGLLPAHIPMLMALDNGREWLIIATLITVSADSGAFYVGTNFGRHKLCPGLSPGKTVEGLAGGVLCALVVVGLSVHLFFPSINLLQSLFFAFILSLAAVAGDLTESLIKRGTGVKDSGGLLPGHGGILDRMDSLLLVVPLLYYLLLAL